MSTSGKRRGQLSNLCFQSHLLHKGKGRGNACAAVMRTFFRVTSSPSSSVEETLMCAHFIDCSGYINRYIDKCPSVVANEFSLTVHPKCSLSKAAHSGYIIYMSCHRGLRTTQRWLRTFNASGEEAGWLYSRLRDNNFLNQKGSGGAQAPMTRTG